MVSAGSLVQVSRDIVIAKKGSKLNEKNVSVPAPMVAAH